MSIQLMPQPFRLLARPGARLPRSPPLYPVANFENFLQSIDFESVRPDRKPPPRAGFLRLPAILHIEDGNRTQSAAAMSANGN
jgi:hypothetical protein